MNFNSFDSLSPAAQAVIRRYAARRGVPENQIQSYLRPDTRPGFSMLPGIAAVEARLRTAISYDENVVVFGDYDADGITSTTILVRFLTECTSLKPSWRLPNRQTGHYGLDMVTAQRLVGEFRPALVVCVDNGSNASDAINWLRSQGVDTIIVDHHPLTEPVATGTLMINPKAAASSGAAELNDLSAAGLVFLLCDQLAQTWNCCSQWDRATALILAGLGTLADAVPLSAINRALAKSAISLINTNASSSHCIGLASLLRCHDGPIRQRNLHFDIIPRLNALGRLDAADPGVELLLTTDASRARQIVAQCNRLNEERKAMQTRIVSEATQRGLELLQTNESRPVLILADYNWHPGVVGPAASQVAERLQRSVILLGPDHAHYGWKGSGRSFFTDNLGEWLRTAKERGLVMRAGGHAAAAGIGLSAEQMSQFLVEAAHLPMPQVTFLPPLVETIGHVDELNPWEWAQVCELLEPFGRDHPRPTVSGILTCCSPAQPLCGRNSDQPWAAKAEFKTPSGRRINLVSTNYHAAQREWIVGSRHALELEPAPRNVGNHTYCDWRVLSSPRTAHDGLTSAAPGDDESLPARRT